MNRIVKFYSKMNINSNGFTLIELVIVIVILGIISSIGIVKYVDLSDEAEEAKLRQAYHSMVYVINTCYGKAAIEGIDITSSAKVNVDFGGITVQLKWGLPAGRSMVSLAGLEEYKNLVSSNRLRVYAGKKRDNNNRVVYLRRNNQVLRLIIKGRKVATYHKPN